MIATDTSYKVIVFSIELYRAAVTSRHERPQVTAFLKFLSREQLIGWEGSPTIPWRIWSKNCMNNILGCQSSKFYKLWMEGDQTIKKEKALENRPPLQRAFHSCFSSQSTSCTWKEIVYDQSTKTLCWILSYRIILCLPTWWGRGTSWLQLFPSLSREIPPSLSDFWSFPPVEN